MRSSPLSGIWDMGMAGSPQPLPCTSWRLSFLLGKKVLGLAVQNGAEGLSHPSLGFRLPFCPVGTIWWLSRTCSPEMGGSDGILGSAVQKVVEHSPHPSVLKSEGLFLAEVQFQSATGFWVPCPGSPTTSVRAGRDHSVQVGAAGSPGLSVGVMSQARPGPERQLMVGNADTVSAPM